MVRKKRMRTAAKSMDRSHRCVDDRIDHPDKDVNNLIFLQMNRKQYIFFLTKFCVKLENTRFIYILSQRKLLSELTFMLLPRRFNSIARSFRRIRIIIIKTRCVTISDIAWQDGYQKRMRGTWGVSVYVAVVQLDTILSNSNAATTKKDVQKVRSIVVCDQQ